METIGPGAHSYLIETLNTDWFISCAYDRESMWDMEITQELKREIYNHYNNKDYSKLQQLLFSLGVKRVPWKPKRTKMFMPLPEC